MMMRVALRRPRWDRARDGAADEPLEPRPLILPAIAAEIARRHNQQIVDAAALHGDGAVHERLAQRQMRASRDARRHAPIAQPHDRRVLALGCFADENLASLRQPDDQRALLEISGDEGLEHRRAPQKPMLT